MTEVRFNSEMEVELVDSMGDEQSIVRAARTSTLGAYTELDEAKGLIRFLVRERHEVPLEHCVMTFRIHAPIFVTRQLLKHRIASISEESGRYKELEPEFYVPESHRYVKQVGKTGNYEFVPDAAAYDYAERAIVHSSGEAWEEYEAMLDKGVAKEVARMVLPVNIYSTVYLTLNLRSALNVVSLRTGRFGSHPQHEIAEVGEQIRDYLLERFPTVLAAYETRMLT